MSLLLYLKKKPPREEPPISGEPPIGLPVLKELIRVLLQNEHSCDHTHKQTKEFLQASSIDVEPVLRWLWQREIHCDCALLKALPNDSLSSLYNLLESNQ